VRAGEDGVEQATILRAWLDWYLEALRTTQEIEVGGSSPETLAAMEAALDRVREAGEGYLEEL
jgi:hypothetical protein